MSESEAALAQVRAGARSLSVRTVEAPLVRQSERERAMFPRWPGELDVRVTTPLGAAVGVVPSALVGVALMAERVSSRPLGLLPWIGGFLFLWMGALVVWGANRHLRRWTWGRRSWQTALPLVANLEGAHEGDLVRVRGTISSGDSFESAVTGRRAVFGIYASPLAVRFTQAIDFALRPERGGDLEIDVGGDHCLLLESPAVVRGRARAIELRVGAEALFDAKLGESLLAPGDRVEAVGVLQLRVDPDGVPDGGRAPRLRARLIAGRGPVLLRRLPARQSPSVSRA